MDRATRLVRHNVAFAAVACVAILVLVLRPSPSSAVPTTFKKAFEGFDAAKARAIEVRHVAKKDGKDVPEQVRLAQQGADQWVVESAGNYPARLATVKRFLDGLGSVEVRNVPTTSPERFGDYGGTDGFTEVKVLDDAGRALVSMGIGASNAEGTWGDRYVRVDDTSIGAGATAGAPPGAGKTRVIVARGGELAEVRADATSWVESRFFPTLTEADVQAITIEQRSKDRTIELRRGTKGEKDTEDPWTMRKPEEGKTHLERVKNLVRSLTGLTISRVIGADASPEGEAKHGFDKPDLVVTATGRVPAGGRPTEVAPTWSLTIGKKSEEKDVDGWFVRRSVGGKAEPYVLLVADYALGDFRSDPSTFLDKPEPPKPPPGVEVHKDGEPPKDGEKPKDGETPKPPADGGAAMEDVPPTPPTGPAMGDAAPPSAPAKPPPSPPPPPPPPPGGDKPK